MMQNRIQGSNSNSELQISDAESIDKLWKDSKIRALIYNNLNVLELLHHLVVRNVVSAQYAVAMQVLEWK